MSYTIDIPVQTKKRKSDFWVCPRCKVNSLETKGHMIPCPRNLNCEAELVGRIEKTIITEVILNKK